MITGKGVSGDGVLRRRVPDWLAEPPIANTSPASPRRTVATAAKAHSTWR
ncbi:MAG: hypothetical protein WDM85_17910 [Caulobacteraceae bacterium]